MLNISSPPSPGQHHAGLATELSEGRRQVEDQGPVREGYDRPRAAAAARYHHPAHQGGEEDHQQCGQLGTHQL